MYDWFAPQIQRATDLARTLEIEWSSRFRNGAPTSRIDACERTIGTPLSHSHRAFLALHDGGTIALLIPGTALVIQDEITILSCAEIVERTIDARSLMDELQEVSRAIDSFGPFVVMAAYGGCGDLCIASEPQTNRDEALIADAFNECPDEWGRDIIAESFAIWLRRIVDSFVEDRCTLAYWLSLPVTEARDYARDS